MPSETLHAFRAVGPPRGLAALVAAHAVVVPLCGSKTAVAVAVDAIRIVKWWRARVWFLERHGWELARPLPTKRGRKWRMLNCPPSAIAVTPESTSCEVSTMCPHCWGRGAVEHWRAIDALLFGKPRKGTDPRRQLAGMTLVRRTLAFQAPFLSVTGRPTLLDLLDRRLERTKDPRWDYSTACMMDRESDIRFLKQAGALGGLEVLDSRPIRLEPEPPQPGQEAPPLDAWCVEARQLLVVPTRLLEAFLAHPRVKHPALVGTLKTRDAPTRAQLAFAVARVCRYPRFLLHGDRRFALAVYRARKGRRLSTRFGCCYGGSK